jgi:hypothetical protein
MRFDPERVMALAGAWTSPGPDTPERGRLVANEIADQLERAGLRVERVEAPPIDPTRWLTALMLSTVFIFEASLGLRSLSLAVRIGLAGASVFSLLAAGRWVDRRVRKRDQDRGWQHLIGRPSREVGAPVRLIVLANIGRSSYESPRGGIWALVLLILYVLPIGMFFDDEWQWFAREIRLNPGLGLDLMFGQWLSLFWIVLWPVWKPTRPSPRSSRLGAALLTELARSWPTGLGDRVETWFVASPNAFALRKELTRTAADRRRTLIVTLGAPGIGDQLVIREIGPARQLARRAARDLWIPHRSPREMLLPIGRARIDLLGSRNNGPINPALVAATAQLVTEIALRWARKASEPTSVS